MIGRDFGFQVCTLPPRRPQQFVQLVQAAERAGFDRYWVADQTFHADPFLVLHELATQTDIDLGLAVTNPYVRHPVQLARAMTTLAHLHQDRHWVFGLGTANPQTVLAPLGVLPQKPARHVRVAVETIRALAAGETVSIDDPELLFALHNVRLDIDPSPPFDLYIGTRGPRMLETAGAVADGAIVEAQFTVPGIDWARKHLDRGSERAGRGQFDRPYIAWQTVDLINEGRGLSAHSTEFGAMLIAATPPETLAAMDVPVDLAEGLRSGRIGPTDVPPAELVKFVAAGTCSELVEAVRSAQSAGANAWAAVLTGTAEEAIEAMEMFGTVIADTRNSAIRAEQRSLHEPRP